MRIEFLTQDDSVYILPLFEEFFRHSASRFEIAQVSCCPAMGSRPRKQLVRELLWLYGPVGFFRLGTRYLMARVAGSLPKGPGARKYHSLEQLCAAYRIPFRKIGNPNAADIVGQIAARQADLMVSVACPYILKSRLLGLPPLGCINIHHAPLPRYKGMMPTFWQLFHGEKQVGLTIHYMVEKVDEGQALLQESLDIHPGESLDHLIRRSKRHAAHCLAEVLQQIETSTVQVRPMNRSGSSYFTFPTYSEIREFHRRGFRAI